MIENSYVPLIKSFFGNPKELSDEVVIFLTERMVEKRFEARQFLLESGRTERFFYIVRSGVQCMYLIDKNGDKVVIGFSFDGSPSGIYDSFINESPSSLFLEALTPSVLIGLDKSSFDELFLSFPELSFWKAQFFESILLGRISREVEILTNTAKERYDAFLARCPEPLKQIPQKYIASYLNMKPETFSRLRALRV